MKQSKIVTESTSLDSELKRFIKQKNDENSALKKILVALENAKKTAVNPKKDN